MALQIRRSAGIAGALVFLVAVAGIVYATLSHSNPVTVIGARQPAGIDLVHYTPGYRAALRARYGDRISVTPYDVQAANA